MTDTVEERNAKDRPPEPATLREAQGGASGVAQNAPPIVALGTPSRLSPLNQRRWQNFKANRRGWWSLWIFAILFVVTLFAEFVANDKPILISYKNEYYAPIFTDYPEEVFGGFLPVTNYRDPFIQDEIAANGWMIWPPIRYSYQSVNNEIRRPRRPRPRGPSPRRSAARATARASMIPTAPSATGTGSAPTIRRATSSPASSTVSASRSCSA